MSNDDDAERAEIVPASAADTQRAYRMRKKVEKGVALNPDDQAWYDDYQRRHPPASARASTRLMLETTGSADAGGDAGLALDPRTVTAEGIRADSLLRLVIDSYRVLGENYERLFNIMAHRMDTSEGHQIEALERIRSAGIREVEARAAMIEAQAGDQTEEDQATETLVTLIAAKLGLIDKKDVAAALGVVKRLPPGSAAQSTGPQKAPPAPGNERPRRATIKQPKRKP